MGRCLSISNIEHFMGEKKHFARLHFWVANRLFQKSRPKAFLPNLAPVSQSSSFHQPDFLYSVSVTKGAVDVEKSKC